MPGKADCENCKRFTPDVEMQNKLGFCHHPRIEKPITSFGARNCDGFGFTPIEIENEEFHNEEAQQHIASLWAILGRDPRPEVEEAKRLARSSGMSINESLGIIEARAAVGIDHNNGDGVSHE